MIGRLINRLLGIVGGIALLFFVYGGILWMTAAGNQERITKGKGAVVWAALGLVAIFSAYAIIKFVTDTLV